MIRISLLIIILLGVLFIRGSKPLVFSIGAEEEKDDTVQAATIDDEATGRALQMRERRSFIPQFIGESYASDFSITARSVFVVDGLTSEPLFTKNAHAMMPIASLAKLMAALTLLDRGEDFDREVRIEEVDLRGGVPEFLLPGEIVSRDDLWHLMLLASSNTALAALVRDSGLEEVEFLEAMREKSNSLFLFEVNFADIAGLNPETVGSARNIARIARLAFVRGEILKIVKKEAHTFTTRNTNRLVRMESTNWLLPSELNTPPFKIIGGKTGYLDESRYNFVMRIQKNSHDIVVVVLGSETKESRFEESARLVRWTFDNYNWRD